MDRAHNEQLAALRRNYQSASLDINQVTQDPMKQFEIWFQNALDSQILEPNAMVLSTVSGLGVPSSRTVLLKRLDPTGFVFFTNYESEKGLDISDNPNVALLFLWLDLERQVRVNGIAEKISREESAAYFNSRPHDSRIGAWASPQSKVIADRAFLEKSFAEYKEKYPGEVVPLPPFWGGFRVVPNSVEFWQGRQNRLHDRIVYKKHGSGWRIERLAP
ncbi:MAG: pyridoxamine 5'-phosphate oxidase [Ignavibacteriales bacterium]|jgi:Pyridoxamine 5'-phosphate oxidase (EC 1.4.3.5)|nr:MAG: pyridoxamine 5'-phosphate oxidase [Ignavibacteriaceae bacterium]MBW7873041.1 pyridoxamine 5'-phosphate oxidase [Ignavibacteria bacterium]MCZ2142331.1 pyridoxamine 5'-phosphate oxidase [Ignavibacteriales bacterium]OQY79697.1 MAG: pyridoxamine 5'-phosphate oxidase [Ignavibacteriales bacterium UTCHB3]MBV6445215.1 Pyridoxine/pyridoxamine 5'-phosphate oxidase [Ignavibacteriaceae bacterium]